MSQPIFSVIIPIHNKGQFVKQAIESVLSQTFSDFELILIDDASTDGSGEVIASFSDPRIRTTHRATPGPGGYAARNKGAEISQGTWLTFLDADDYWEPSHLDHAQQILLLHPTIRFISFAYQLHQGVNTYSIGVNQDQTCSRLQALTYFTQRNIFHTNSVVILKNLFQQVGGFPDGKYRRGGDSDLWLRLILTSPEIFLSSIVTSHFITDNSGVMVNPLNLTEHHPILQTIQNNLTSSKFSNEEKQILKKLANRKSFMWSIERKKQNMFQIAEMSNFYPTSFSAKQWLKWFLLASPLWLFRKFYR